MRPWVHTESFTRGRGLLRVNETGAVVPMWLLALTLVISMLPAAPFAHAGCIGAEARVGSDMRCLRPKDMFRDCLECAEMVMIPANLLDDAAGHRHAKLRGRRGNGRLHAGGPNGAETVAFRPPTR